MRLPKSFCGLIASLLVSACGSSTEPRSAEAPSPTAVEREPKTPPALPEPRGPAGLLETSPAETWDGTPLRVMLSDVAVKKAAPASQLSFEILIFDGMDASKPPIDSLDPKDLALTLDGLYVPGTWEVTPFRQSGRGVALGVLVAGHRGYSAPLDEASGQMWSPLSALRDGTKALLAKLGDNDKVALFGFTHDEFKTIRRFGPPAGLADLVGNLPAANEDATSSPETYKSILKALSIFQDSVAELPSRKILLLASDATNRTDKAAIIDRQINEVSELALAENVTPWVIGFTLAEPEPLVNLEALAAKANGRYLALGFDEHPKLGERFAALAEEARGGFVVTLTPAPGVRLPERANEVRLALRSGGGVGRATSRKLELGR